MVNTGQGQAFLPAFIPLATKLSEAVKIFTITFWLMCRDRLIDSASAFQRLWD
jgi:hypothetical protein